MIKNLLSKIPKDMIIVKIKKKFKFYSINLEKLDTIILKESIKSIQNKT